MTEVKILIEGYAKPLENGWLANSSVVFIKSNGKNIVADPGSDREKLLNALKNEKQVVDIKKRGNDPEHVNIQKLIASRKKLLELADYIIPGHGTMFKVKK